MISVKDYIKLSTTLSLLTRVTINNLLTYCEIYLVGSPKNTKFNNYRAETDQTGLVRSNPVWYGITYLLYSTLNILDCDVIFQ